MFRKWAIVLAIIILPFTLSGCTDDGEIPTTSTISASEATTNDVSVNQSTILAIVNDHPITEFELVRESVRLFGEKNIANLGDAGTSKLLQSIVARRAMALIMENEMSENEVRILKEDVNSYREKALMKTYISRNAKPDPVTDEMVNKYYENHLNEFGGSPIRTYEIISAAKKLRGPTQAELIKKLGKVISTNNWKDMASEINATEQLVFYQRGNFEESIFEASLGSLMGSLKKGEAEFILLKGKPNIVRLLDESSGRPQPLSAVSGKIRRNLLSIQVKNSIRNASIIAIDKSEVSMATKIYSK